jgi:hypothetical protein
LKKKEKIYMKIFGGLCVCDYFQFPSHNVYHINIGGL